MSFLHGTTERSKNIPGLVHEICNAQCNEGWDSQFEPRVRVGHTSCHFSICSLADQSFKNGEGKYEQYLFAH